MPRTKKKEAPSKIGSCLEMMDIHPWLNKGMIQTPTPETRSFFDWTREFGVTELADRTSFHAQYSVQLSRREFFIIFEKLPANRR